MQTSNSESVSAALTEILRDDMNVDIRRVTRRRSGFPERPVKPLASALADALTSSGRDLVVLEDGCGAVIPGRK